MMVYYSAERMDTKSEDARVDQKVEMMVVLMERKMGEK